MTRADRRLRGKGSVSPVGFARGACEAVFVPASECKFRPMIVPSGTTMRIQKIFDDPKLHALRADLLSPRGVVHVTGLWGSSAPIVLAWTMPCDAPLCLYLTAHTEEADNARDDLELTLERPCDLFPAWEGLPGEGPGAAEILAERLRLCAEILRPARKADSNGPRFVVAPVQALMQPVPTAEGLESRTLRLAVGRGLGGDLRSPADLVGWLVDRGYERLDRVEAPGDVALRGDIVDVFVPGELNPCRLQFFGDEVESIRVFEIGAQRSLESAQAISITTLRGAPDAAEAPETTDLLSYLPAGSWVVLDDPAAIQELGATLLRRLGEATGLQSVQAVLARAATFPQVHVARFGGAATSHERVHHFPVNSLARFEGSAADVAAELGRVSTDRDVVVMCDNVGERERLLQMAAETPSIVLDRIDVRIGSIHRGFEWVDAATIVVAHHELFHRERQRRRIRRIHAGRPLEAFTELAAGDLVVHLSHGIALYRGLQTLQKGDAGQKEEFLTLEFADHAVIHVPTSQIDVVQKYIGVPGRKPKLSTLGGKRWSKTKQQVSEAVSELAESLLRIQAMRDATIGTAYPDDTNWQREFEASFLYDETEDQLTVAGEIRGDLCRARPMDRLICGDVGYGKTELAMRAAFKVVEFGRQVAVLVPTTVLAEQHYETFRDRMADYPFRIGCLSRFRSAKEIRKIVEQARKGQIDIVVGTHRLFSKDVSFANLGLVIIDEEQRFGVEHKERLKQMRATVDVLTLTATPIPRTLHMSMSGLRDISMLQTPPIDRRAIATQVRPFDEGLIRDAVLREMNRDGQVYFVHNFVYSIAAMADTIRRIVPEARVLYGHGQMADEELEDVMHRFLRREADVLVATTIIESGIDIPTANTIFINRADRFGLADLHQLRGRVGRSHHRAYCYLLLPHDRTVTDKAAKRLKTIEEFSELGAGFRIAMRDLEIRGAGNLLGKEQSGHIAAVGYDLYCRMLETTVRKLKNQPDAAPPALSIDLDVAAYIPPNYVSAERARIDVYRRLALANSPADLAQLERDLVDAYGPVPKLVERLIQLAEIRVLARACSISSISLRPPDVVFHVDHLPSAEAVFRSAPGSVRMADARTVHLRLPPSYLEPRTLPAVLKRMFERAGSAVAAE